MWDSMMNEYSGKWRSVAIQQSKTYFSPSADNLKQSAKMYVWGWAGGTRAVGPTTGNNH